MALPLAFFVRTMESRHCIVVPPSCKRLACGDVGRGALAPVKDIVQVVLAACEGLGWMELQKLYVDFCWKRCQI